MTFIPPNIRERFERAFREAYAQAERVAGTDETPTRVLRIWSETNGWPDPTLAAQIALLDELSGYRLLASTLRRLERGDPPELAPTNIYYDTSLCPANALEFLNMKADPGQVNHFYYGCSVYSDDRTGAVQFVEAWKVNGDKVRFPHVVQWSVEYPRGQHERIWRNREPISEVVQRHAGRCRINVTFRGDQMTISDYDWARWEETVAALP